MPSVLVTGGTGYLGQFLVQALCADLGTRVALTYHSRAPSEAELAALGNPKAIRVDFRTGEGLQTCFEIFGGHPDVVINCAAMSVPRDCETNPEAAWAVNVPQALLAWLQKQNASAPPLLVHLSTDQVYSGAKAWNTEGDPPAPVNTYGRTKVAAEKAIQEGWGNYAILRSSIIVGPPAPAIQLSKTPPLVWMDKALASGQPSTFFFDEYRCPILVHDLVEVSRGLIQLAGQGSPLQLLLNAGGPDRLSRAGMAEVLAQVRGYASATPADVAAGAVVVEGTSGSLPPLSSIIKRVPAASAGNRGVESPLDISMETLRITSALGLKLTPFSAACLASFSGAVA